MLPYGSANIQPLYLSHKLFFLNRVFVNICLERTDPQKKCCTVYTYSIYLQCNIKTNIMKISIEDLATELARLRVLESPLDSNKSFDDYYEYYLSAIRNHKN